MISLYAFHPQPTQNGRETENLAIGGSSVSSAHTSAGGVYRLCATSDCYIRLSKRADTDAGAGTATAADVLLPSRTPMVLMADHWDMISVIQVSAAGILGITRVQPPA